MSTTNPWAFYDTLIDAIPDDIPVTDYALGIHWSYVNSEAGMGVSFTTRQGASSQKGFDLSGKTLKEVAALSKSWCFEEATLGVAALNAWHNNKERLSASGMQCTFEDPRRDDEGKRLGMKLDAFDVYRPKIEALENPRVVVVGHFPHVDRIAEYSQLTVLERKCSDEWDTPDPACEYVMPEADFAYITGVTIINKTAPRLLTLAKDARVIMVGPSVVMSPALLDWGVESLSGSIVTDPEQAAFACKNGIGKFFGPALQMCMVTG